MRHQCAKFPENQKCPRSRFASWNSAKFATEMPFEFFVIPPFVMLYFLNTKECAKMNTDQSKFVELRVFKREVVGRQRKLRRLGRCNVGLALEIVPLDFPQCADPAVAVGAMVMLSRLLSDPDQRAEMARLGTKTLEVYGGLTLDRTGPAAKVVTELMVDSVDDGGLVDDSSTDAEPDFVTTEAEARISAEVEDRVEVAVVSAGPLATAMEIDVGPEEDGLPTQMVEAAEATDEEIPEFLKGLCSADRGNSEGDVHRTRGAGIFGRRRGT